MIPPAPDHPPSSVEPDLQSSESAAADSGGADAASNGSSQSTQPVGAVAVKLSLFEGPLDLLLHLIRINEVDVTDIPIAQIAAQYVETIELMEELDLDVAGEYLVMAATLGWIKSRLLLPTIEAEGDEDEADPRAELMQRLLEYQRFKEVSEEIGELHREGRDVFRAATVDIEATPEGEREIAVTLVDLLEAYRRVVRGKPKRVRTVHEVETETITVHERMVAVMERLDAAEQLEFHQVFAAEGLSEPSRAVVVTTFLAILELMRLSALRAYQGLDDEGVPEGPIRLRRQQTDDGRHWRDRIAEVM